jgi:hypothetical protein
MFGGEGTPGAHAFAWTFSIKSGSFARVSGSPDSWETLSAASNSWPGAVSGFGFFRSAFGAFSFLKQFQTFTHSIS